MSTDRARKLIVAAESARCEIINGRYPHRFAICSELYRDNMLLAAEIAPLYALRQASVQLNTPMGKLTDQTYMLMRITAGLVVGIAVIAAGRLVTTMRAEPSEKDKSSVDHSLNMLINEVAALQGGIVSMAGESFPLLPEEETKKCP